MWNITLAEALDKRGPSRTSVADGPRLATQRFMMLEPRLRRALSPEEGALLGRLADHPQEVTRFTPAAPDRSGYQTFNADVVWPLEELKRRGFVAIIERAAADTGGAERFWNAIAAELTPAGREAVAGRPRNSLGQPGIPER